MFGTLKGRIAIIVLLLVTAGYFLWHNGLRLGLDLQGGMHLALEVADSAGTLTPKAKAEATDRALAATEDAELVVLPAFTGGPEQLWRFDQLAGGSWRIMPKAVPNSKEPLALSAVGSSFATLATFDPASDKQRWLLKTP